MSTVEFDQSQDHEKFPQNPHRNCVKPRANLRNAAFGPNVLKATIIIRTSQHIDNSSCMSLTAASPRHFEQYRASGDIPVHPPYKAHP